MRTVKTLAAATIATATLTVPAAADAASGSFQTPTGNIVCSYWTGYGGALDCTVRSADVTYTMTRTGFPRVYDAYGRGAGSFTLGYGRHVSVGSFRCSSRFDGLHCTNRRGHGYFLSTQERYRF